MPTVRAIAFWGQLDAFVNSVVEFRFGLWREHWRKRCIEKFVTGLCCTHCERLEKTVTVQGLFFIFIAF